MSESPAAKVGLFVTCLADLFRPSVAFASIKLLEAAGCAVEVPRQQTCCGQPGYNSGAYADTLPLARQVIKAFADYDYLVAPSGSCVGMIRHHYPRLFKDSPQWQARAQDLASRSWEITSFLVDVLDYKPATVNSALKDRTVTYHDSCAGLRELGIRQQPRQLLRDACSATIVELQQPDVCCGFGGTFCAKMPHISAHMVDDKLDDALGTSAGMLLGGDLGCLLNISGRAARAGKSLEVRHVTEVLADQLDQPAIGEPEP